jgi:hypothetical protein
MSLQPIVQSNGGERRSLETTNPFSISRTPELCDLGANSIGGFCSTCLVMQHS